MSALIKSGGADIRHFAKRATASARTDALPPQPAAIDPRDAEIVSLRMEIKRAGDALAEARESADRAILDAHEKGRRAGLADAVRDEAERLEALDTGIRDAVTTFEARMDSLDGLAAGLARVAISKLFAGREDWSEMVAAMVARQLTRIRRASVVAIHVSPQDFPDPSQLAETTGAAIAFDPELAAGACRIECKLGQIDLDARAQWAELSALLERMEAGA